MSDVIFTLEEAIAYVNEQWDLLTPEEQAEHVKAQKKSWVYGNCKLSNPNVTREMVDKIVEESDV